MPHNPQQNHQLTLKKIFGETYLYFFFMLFKCLHFRQTLYTDWEIKTIEIFIAQ